MSDCANCSQAQARRKQQWVAPRRESPLTGILNVDKPGGMTSHDVVGVVRRVTGQRKVGHAGTLDPMATGVLVVCLGQATRVAEYSMAGRKRYRAVIVLGTTTDTYDAEGEITSSGGPVDPGRDEIEATLAGFVGHIKQVPPMYSALKRDGRPLYELARQGKTVERQARPVEIYEITLLDWTPPALTLEVTCSPGTYIRSLAHDLGQQLGSGAYLAALVRLSSGKFRLEDAVSLERLAEAFEHGQGEQYVLPIDEVLLDMPAMIVGDQEAQRITTGQAIVGYQQTAGGDGESLCRAYNVEGEFLAILAYDEAAGRWLPKKVFSPSSTEPHTANLGEQDTV